MKEMRVLGHNIKRLIRKKAFTIKHVALAIRVSEGDLYSVIIGRKFLSYDQLTDLSKLLDEPIDVLFDEDRTYKENYLREMGNLTLKSMSDDTEKVLDIIDDYMTLIDATKEPL